MFPSPAGCKLCKGSSLVLVLYGVWISDYYKKKKNLEDLTAHFFTLLGVKISVWVKPKYYLELKFFNFCSIASW